MNDVWEALLWVVGLLAATICCSAFVIGGLLAGASGLPAMLLAASIPTAALTFAIILSVYDRP